MTLLQIEKRVKVLEQALKGLSRSRPKIPRRWYRTHAGRFANDPVFNKIAKLGRAYRKSQGSPRHKRRS